MNFSTISNTILSQTTTAWILAMATMVGAFGGFPEPPKVFAVLTQFTLVQWFLVFVLIFQGGGSQNVIFSAALTVITFLVYWVVRFFESEEKNILGRVGIKL